MINNSLKIRIYLNHVEDLVLCLSEAFNNNDYAAAIALCDKIILFTKRIKELKQNKSRRRNYDGFKLL